MKRQKNALVKVLASLCMMAAMLVACGLSATTAYAAAGRYEITVTCEALIKDTGSGNETTTSVSDVYYSDSLPYTASYEQDGLGSSPEQLYEKAYNKVFGEQVTIVSETDSTYQQGTSPNHHTYTFTSGNTPGKVQYDNNPVYYSVGSGGTARHIKASYSVTVRDMRDYYLTFTVMSGHGTAFASAPNPLHAGDVVTLIASPDIGYKMSTLGWITQDQSIISGDELTMPADDVDVSVTYVPIIYLVKYDKNGGSGTMDIQTAEYDQIEYLSGCSYTRDGYAFSGWKGPDGVVYKAGDPFRNLASTDLGEVTFTAQWEPIMCTVTFDANGGSGTMDSQAVQPNS